jgi:lipoprotein-anchoring transpeptidase ErfK/SrfK
VQHPFQTFHRPRHALWLVIGIAIVVLVPAILLIRGIGGERQQNQATHAVAIAVPAYGESMNLPEAAASALSRGDPKRAVEHLKTALEDPTQADQKPRLLLALAHALIAAGQEADALQVATELTRNHPSTPYAGDALGIVADSAHRAGRQTESYELWQKISTNHPSCGAAAVALQQLSERAQQDGDLDAALRYASAQLIRSTTAAERATILAETERLARQVVYSQRPMSAAIFHEVKPGDALVKIAARYGSSVGLLRAINGKQDKHGKAVDTIYIGERLKVLKGEFHIVVHKSLHQLTVLVAGYYVKHYPVGLGEDDRTPIGDFVINTKLEHPVWWWNNTRIPYGDPRHKIGTRWLGFAPKPGATGLGIHGTSEPDSVGKNMSAGCIRLHNHHVEELFDMVPTKTTVTILP